MSVPILNLPTSFGVNVAVKTDPFLTTWHFFMRPDGEPASTTTLPVDESP